jgi:hypothetical protein
MARGQIIREWKCDSCGAILRMDKGGAGDDPLPPAATLDSWRLPDGWVRIRVEHASVDPMREEPPIEACDACYANASGKLAAVRRTLDAMAKAGMETELRAAVDLAKQSKYEKIHTPKGERVSSGQGGAE